MPTHIASVEVMVSDLKKAVKWYQELLGFKIIRRTPAYKLAQLGLHRGETLLNLWQPVSDWGLKNYRDWQRLIGRVTGITLQTDNLERLYKHVLSKKARVLEPPRKLPYGIIRMRVADPDGNELTIVEKLKARKPRKD